MSPESGPCSSVCWDRQGWDLVGSVVIVQMDLCSARKVGALLLAVKEEGADVNRYGFPSATRRQSGP